MDLNIFEMLIEFASLMGYRTEKKTSKSVQTGRGKRR